MQRRLHANTGKSRRINVVFVCCFLFGLLVACGLERSRQSTAESSSAYVLLGQDSLGADTLPPNEVLKFDTQRAVWRLPGCAEGDCLELELYMPRILFSRADLGERLNRHIWYYPLVCYNQDYGFNLQDYNELLPLLYTHEQLGQQSTHVYYGAEVTYASSELLCIGYSAHKQLYLMLDISTAEPLERSAWFDTRGETQLLRLIEEELRRMYNLRPHEPLSKAGFRFHDGQLRLPEQIGYQRGFHGAEDMLVCVINKNDGATDQSGTPEVRIPFSKVRMWLRRL